MKEKEKRLVMFVSSLGLFSDCRPSLPSTGMLGVSLLIAQFLIVLDTRLCNNGWSTGSAY